MMESRNSPQATAKKTGRRNGGHKSNSKGMLSDDGIIYSLMPRQIIRNQAEGSKLAAGIAQGTILGRRSSLLLVLVRSRGKLKSITVRSS
eukprot:5195164-Amphidinium_carterae.1